MTEPSCEQAEQPRRETERTLESRYWTDQDVLGLPGAEDFQPEVPAPNKNHGSSSTNKATATN